MCPAIEYLIFFTYPGLRYDVHEPSAPPIIGKGIFEIGHWVKLYGKDNDLFISNEGAGFFYSIQFT
jgi:hypothetical protein